MRKQATPIGRNSEKQHVVSLNSPIQLRDPDSLFKQFGTNQDHIGKYILSHYTNPSFYLPVINFQASRDDLGKVAEYFGIPVQLNNTLSPEQNYSTFNKTVAGTLKTLGQALTQNLLEKYPALRDVELHFGWSVENNFCLFAVKQLVQTGNNS